MPDSSNKQTFYGKDVRNEEITDRLKVSTEDPKKLIWSTTSLPRVQSREIESYIWIFVLWALT